MTIAVRAENNKDRWFVTVDPATGAARVLDNQHDEAWIREQGIGGGGGFGGGAGIAWLPDNKRFLFLSEKTGYLHLHSIDMSAAQPAAKATLVAAFGAASAVTSRRKVPQSTGASIFAGAAVPRSKVPEATREVDSTTW